MIKLNIHKDYYIVAGTAFALAILYFIVILFGQNVPRYSYTAGQIAQSSIRTPIAFNVMKTDRMIEAEVTRAMVNYPPIYMISDEFNFNILRRLNDFFIDLNNLAQTNDPIFITNFFNINGLFFTAQQTEHLLNTNNRNRIYNHLTEQFSALMGMPIINDDDKGRILRITDPNRVSENIVASVITLTEAKSQILRRITNPTQREIMSDIIDVFLETNVVIDLEAMNNEREILRRSIDPVITRVESNEYVVLRNDRLTELDILKLEAFRNNMIERQGLNSYGMLVISTLGQFLYTLLILMLFYYFTKIFFGERFLLKKNLLLIFGTFFSTILVSSLLYYVFDIRNIMLLPVPMFILIMAMIYRPRYGVIFSLFIVLVIGQFLHWEMIPIGNLIIASIVCLLVLQQTKQSNYLLIFIYMFCSLVITTLITTLYRTESFAALSLNLLFCLFNSIASMVGAYLIIPRLEKLLEHTTKSVLLELMDYNNPLLKRLSKEAQGTYYHSLIVGNLAEECAEAIGANSMIARVGSYYHDIGKLENPEFFIENVKDKNPHNDLNPLESALIIKKHLKYGINLARKSKIPYQIIDIIQQHHGDGKIKYFLHKANEIGMDYNPEDFHYSGPKPKTKEAAIVMIADIVESTTKASPDPSEINIKKIIDDTVNALWADDQLMDAPITLKELAKIKNTLLPILCSLHRKRVEYPKEAL